jgi:hypothetical protein
MKLVTCQPYGFDITKDKLDLSKSSNLREKFDTNSMFKKAYKWLFDQIGYNELIWCYQLENSAYITAKSNGNHINHGNEHVLWTLEVPRNEFVIINSDIWECVINGWPYCTDEMVKNLSDDDYDKLMVALEPTKEDVWKNNIFKVEDEHVEVLIKSPVLEQYVVNKEWICDYDLKLFSDKEGIIRSIYHDKQDMERDIEIYKSAFRGKKIRYELSTSETAACGGFLLDIDWVKD